MKPAIWQRPVFVLLCGVLIVFTSLGIRNSFGLFTLRLGAALGDFLVEAAEAGAELTGRID